VVSPVCSYNSLVVNNKELIADAWLYLLGVELMFERQFTSRINRLTTVDAEDAEKLRDVFTAKYEEAFNDFVSGIQINAHDGCIECRQTIKRVTSLP